jgi:hypothetical protein
MNTTHKHGCHNRPEFKPVVDLGKYPIVDSNNELWAASMSFPFRMATDCQYTKTELGRKDKSCHECRHRIADGSSS